jgi:ABC-2 type transport system permease protein
VLAAFGATLTIALPVAVVPATLAAAVSGVGPELTVGALASTALATLGYASVFLGLGLVAKRALAWGLAYILIWEGAVARVARGAARLSIGSYSRSVLADLADRPPTRFPTSMPVAVGVVVLVSAAALLLTVRLLARDEVP